VYGNGLGRKECELTFLIFLKQILEMCTPVWSSVLIYCIYSFVIDWANQVLCCCITCICKFSCR